jgi:hypothetical protein
VNHSSYISDGKDKNKFPSASCCKPNGDAGGKGYEDLIVNQLWDLRGKGRRRSMLLRKTKKRRNENLTNYCEQNR